MRKIAVFDLDGTLHHTEIALAPAIADAAGDVTGAEKPSFDLINSLYGEPIEEFCRVLTGRTDEKTFNLFVDRVKFYQAITIPELGALYPGTIKMLEELRDRGYDLAVLSNANLDYIQAVTEQLNIRHFFGRIQGKNAVSSKSRRLAELIEDYEFAVMAGDRYHDVQAALENSIPAIACSYGYGSEKEHEGALKVKNPGEIVEVIEGLFRQGTGTEQ